MTENQMKELMNKLLKEISGKSNGRSMVVPKQK